MDLFTRHGTCELLDMARREALPDEQWALLAPFIPVQPRRADGRGRPLKRDDRAVLNGVLWVLRTGAAWADLPERLPSGATCFRRFSRGVTAGGMRTLLETLARDLEERGQIDLAECFIDGTFGVAKQGGPKWVRPSGATGRRAWLWQTLLVFHAPCTRLLLRHMTSPVSRLPSLAPTPWDDPDDLSGIVPTTVIRSSTHSRPRAAR
jgi:transposase